MTQARLHNIVSANGPLLHNDTHKSSSRGKEDKPFKGVNEEGRKPWEWDYKMDGGWDFNSQANVVHGQVKKLLILVEKKDICGTGKRITRVPSFHIFEG